MYAADDIGNPNEKTGPKSQDLTNIIKKKSIQVSKILLYPDSGIPMDKEIGLGNMIWSYSKADL